ncbi:hypothetical protein, partial [Amphritea sp.]|uniref:hypothetical protein n=1 Tax=Amphritea sp. TaxID=1872502 RepID=UPI003A90F90C
CVAYFDKAFVLHLNKRPHELSDLSVKERCLKMQTEFFSHFAKAIRFRRLKRGAYFTQHPDEVNHFI